MLSEVFCQIEFIIHLPVLIIVPIYAEYSLEGGAPANAGKTQSERNHPNREDQTKHLASPETVRQVNNQAAFLLNTDISFLSHILQLIGSNSQAGEEFLVAEQLNEQCCVSVCVSVYPCFCVSVCLQKKIKHLMGTLPCYHE